MSGRILKPAVAYTLDEAAEAVGISRDLLDDAIKAGDLNRRFVRSKPIISASELAAWVESLPLERSQ